MEINTYGKGNTKSRGETEIYVEIPCGEKPRVTVRQFHYKIKQIQEVGANKCGGTPNPPHISLF
jgi:hypothetical protein